MTVLCVITNNHRGLALQLERVIGDRSSQKTKRFRKLANPFPLKLDLKKMKTKSDRIYLAVWNLQSALSLE